MDAAVVAAGDEPETPGRVAIDEAPGLLTSICHTLIRCRTVYVSNRTTSKCIVFGLCFAIFFLNKAIFSDQDPPVPWQL